MNIFRLTLVYVGVECRLEQAQTRGEAGYNKWFASLDSRHQTP